MQELEKPISEQKKLAPVTESLLRYEVSSEQVLAVPPIDAE